MASINEKLNYINETKSLIKDKLNDLGSEIDNETTFREYAEKIEDLYEEWPKTSSTNINITLNNTKKGKIKIDLKGNTNQFTTTGKNRLNLNLNKIVDQSGITYSVSNNGTITINGTASARVEIDYLNEILHSIANTKYSLSFIYISGTLNGTMYIYNQDGNHGWNGYNLDIIGTGNLSNQSRVTSYTTDLDMNGAKIIRIEKNAVFNNLKFKLQFVQSENADYVYEPYTGGIASPNPEYPQEIEVITGENTITISNEDNTQSQIFNINLDNLELCKNNDYQDYIYGTFNNWYKKQIISKVILNGTENWQSASSVVIGSSRFYYDNIDCLNNNIGSAINIHSKNFKAMSWQQIFADDTVNKNGIALWASEALTGRIVVRIDNTYANTTDNFKTWLSNNNIKAYFVQATSTDIPITDITLITQLNALEQAMSYNNQTNISQENDNLPFILSASALLKNSN